MSASAPLKLYFNPQSRAVVTQWLLDEAGLDYEIVPIEWGPEGSRSPQFLAISPTGKLPALGDGEVTVFESVAIALYLGERNPEAGLAPAVGDPKRGRFLSLMVFATSQLEPTIGDALLGLERHRSRGWTDLDTALQVVEDQLGEGPFLLGDRFTALDVLIGSQLAWYPKPLSPALTAYVKRLLERPHAAQMRAIVESRSSS